MRNHAFHRLTFGFVILLVVTSLYSQNPLIMDQFTADPTARVFEGRIYVYPSHDIPASPGKGRANWFVMEDYHVFSSENLVDWKDHGVILSQDKVEWVSPADYAMWAPDCVFRNGKYYFYFPATAKATTPGGRGGASRIGVAIADRPYGPFKPEPKPMDGPVGIDPCVLVDKDGTAYLYYALGGIFVAKLKDNMVELDSKPQALQNLPVEGLVEGPFVFERNGIYYLTYPHVANKIERLEYAMGKSPWGPFTFSGVIMDESASGCWTNHHSLVEYKGQWYLFYHDMDLSPEFDKNRSIRADALFFNEDGTIRKVVPTLRGVGIVDAKSKIQIDRYSAVSDAGTSVSFLNSADKFAGWKITLDGSNAWVRFNRVDCGKGGLRTVNIRAASSTGGSVEIHLDSLDGPVVAKVKIDRGTEWNIAHSKPGRIPSGLHNLFVTQTEKSIVALDWVRFE
jgi:hypothetical protein